MLFFLNFQLIKDSLSQLYHSITVSIKIVSRTTVLNTDNNNKCFLTENRHIQMVSEGLCDTEGWWKFSFAITGINDML